MSDALSRLHQMQLAATGAVARAVAAIGPHVASVLNAEDRARIDDAMADLNKVGEAINEVVADVPALLRTAADVAVSEALSRLMPDHVAAVADEATAAVVSRIPAPAPATPPAPASENQSS